MDKLPYGNQFCQHIGLLKMNHVKIKLTYCIITVLVTTDKRETKRIPTTFPFSFIPFPTLNVLSF